MEIVGYATQIRRTHNALNETPFLLEISIERAVGGR